MASFFIHNSSLELIPQRFTDLLRNAHQEISGLLPLRMMLSREQRRLTVTLTDVIGELSWPANPGEDVLKALSWMDVTATIFIDTLGWVR
jgi:hypothetical protein